MTLGQLAPLPSGNTSNVDYIGLTSSAGYAAPSAGTITSWSTNAQNISGQMAALKVYRKVGDPAFYQVVGLDGPQPLNAGLINNFTVNIPVQSGDLIGMTGTAGQVTVLFTGAPTDSFLQRIPSPTLLNLGDQAGFTGPNTGAKLNLQATFEPKPPPAANPSNDFTIAGTILNKKNGTATLNFTLPGPGDLTATGPGVSAASAGGAVISKAVGAGPAQIVVAAAGKQKKKLRQKGKVTLSVAVTYTPTGGTPKTQSVSVNLKLKKKKK